jgi:two-component system NtrC family response regulator
VIIITGEGDPDGADLAIRGGAWDYIEKPLSVNRITLPLERALQFREEKASRQPVMALDREGILGSSAPILESLNRVAQAAAGDVSTLVTGETGTGKELFAHAIHRNSSRREKNFVVVDCTALPETLVESTLFGHRRGAFTGADRDRDGLVRTADGGTLFLDEVAELPFPVQGSFLRVLQEKRFRPVGGKEEISSDFRLVAATNRNIEEMAERGDFRKDLLFRINSLSIALPPLREREGDILDMARHFADRFYGGRRRDTAGISPELQDALGAYPWPGNVRELAGVMESACTTAGISPILYPHHLPTAVRVAVARSGVRGKGEVKTFPPASGSPPAGIPTIREFRETVLKEAEVSYLRNLMDSTDWNIKEACRISGLSRARLYALLNRHGISR